MAANSIASTVAGHEITAGVGAKLKQVAYAAKAAGLGGLEWMEGIPGEVGGGVAHERGRDGCRRRSRMSSAVRYFDREGHAHTEDAGRTGSALPARAIAGDELRRLRRLSAVNPRREKRSFGGSTNRRRNVGPRQPAASSAGCIFKNPVACPAGKLVDELGLKNCAVGHARVSEVHGNFIVNDGGATAAEMLELIEKIKTTAREKRGIELETEVQIVGEEA